MTARVPLADRVAASATADLLPARLAATDGVLSTGLSLVAAHRLGIGLWLMLLESAEAFHTAPVVDDGLRLRRAVAGDGAAEALIRALAGGTPSQGPFQWQRLQVVDTPAGERAMGVDQTHESVVVGDQAVVKWMVKVEETPATSVVAHLTETGFSAMPRALGFVTWGEPSPIVLAAVTEFLPGASDGWRWCVDDVGRISRGKEPETSGQQTARALGELVAEMHLSLAKPSSVHPTPIRAVGAGEVTRWHEHANSLLSEATHIVTDSAGRRLRERRPQIEAAIGELDGIDACETMPIHGDLHVGQVLRWDGGYAINDFDGNPVLEASERTRRQPAARDVAGMMQSLDHVGRVVMRRVEDADETRTKAWIEAAQQEFLTQYTQRLADEGHRELLDHRLLMPFRVEQELREYIYAERHLPRWRYVPDGAMTSMFPKE